jgi:hypothetical protein
MVCTEVRAKARPDETVPPPAPTGIDYLNLVQTRHAATLTTRLRYAGLAHPSHDEEQIPGQLTVPGTDPDDAPGDGTTSDTTSDGQAQS